MSAEQYSITPEVARDTYRAVLEGMGFQNLDELAKHGVEDGRRVGEQGRENGEATSALCEILGAKVSYLTADRNEAIEALEGMARIVEAFGYAAQLGRSQRERLNKARALVARIKGES